MISNVRVIRVVALVVLAAFLQGCGSYPLEGKWRLEGPKGNVTVIIFKPDGTYLHDVANGEVVCKGTYRLAGKSLTLQQSAWYSPGRNLRMLSQDYPLSDIEMDIEWESPDQAKLSGGGITKVLSRQSTRS
jgi:hypothetical protein